MADPREDVGMEGIGELRVTFKHDASIIYDVTKVGGSAQVGLAVTLSGDREVSLVADGEGVKGKLIKVEPGGVCVVQTKGYMTLPAGTAAVLTKNKKIVGDLLVAAEGYIRECAPAVAAELGVARGEIVDSSVTTAVLVEL